MTSPEMRGWLFEYYTHTHETEKYDQVNQRTIDSMNFIRGSMSEQADSIRQSTMLQREKWTFTYQI